MFINIYVFRTDTLEFQYQDTGNPEYVINDLGDNKDFTLVPPPDDTKTWKWIDDHWE